MTMFPKPGAKRKPGKKKITITRWVDVKPKPRKRLPGPGRPPKPKHPERSREQHVLQYTGGIGHDDWIRTQQCVVANCQRHSEAAHAVSRGAGGMWIHLVPLCHAHHMEQHRRGTLLFEQAYSVDLHRAAARLALEHMKGICDESVPGLPW